MRPVIHVKTTGPGPRYPREILDNFNYCYRTEISTVIDMSNNTIKPFNETITSSATEDDISTGQKIEMVSFVVVAGVVGVLALQFRPALLLEPLAMYGFFNMSFPATLLIIFLMAVLVRHDMLRTEARSRESIVQKIKSMPRGKSAGL
jgi:hypothetical protein